MNMACRLLIQLLLCSVLVLLGSLSGTADTSFIVNGESEVKKHNHGKETNIGDSVDAEENLIEFEDLILENYWLLPGDPDSASTHASSIDAAAELSRFSTSFASRKEGPSKNSISDENSNTTLPRHWALLVASSKGYWNYRHQSDVCHAYHTLLSHGVPADRIIVMMVDDAANANENPYPGKLFNRPTKRNGTEQNEDAVDYYEGCRIDYRGEDVTPSMFLAVLSGNASYVEGKGTERVIRSSSEDFLFVNLVDHGAPGLVAFPQDELHASDLNHTLYEMYTRNMYHQMVFYLEACESGSMFEEILPEDWNIYVTTAANPHESSFAAYCPPNQDNVGGIHLHTCLGDLYSVNWMEDSDVAAMENETLAWQYEKVKAETQTRSHVMQYGEMGIGQEVLGDFQGDLDLNGRRMSRGVARELVYADSVQSTQEDKGAVDARDVALIGKFYRYVRASNAGADMSRVSQYAADLMEEIDHRRVVDNMFHHLTLHLGFSVQDHSVKEMVRPTNFSCLKGVVGDVRAHCGDFSDYALKHLYRVVYFCEQGVPEETIRRAAREVCGRVARASQLQTTYDFAKDELVSAAQ